MNIIMIYIELKYQITYYYNNKHHNFYLNNTLMLIIIICNLKLIITHNQLREISQIKAQLL